MFFLLFPTFWICIMFFEETVFLYLFKWNKSNFSILKMISFFRKVFFFWFSFKQLLVPFSYFFLYIKRKNLIMINETNDIESKEMGDVILDTK